MRRRKRALMDESARLGLAIVVGASYGHLFAKQPEHSIRSLLETVMAKAGPGPQEPEEAAAFEKLYAMPTAELLAQLAPLMRADPRFRDPDSTWKWVGYRLLVRHEAEKHEVGRQLLIEGLAEESDSIRRMCLDRLAYHLPPGDYAEVREAVRTLWDAARIEELPITLEYPEDDFAKLRISILAAGLAVGVLDNEASMRLLVDALGNANLPDFVRIHVAGHILERAGYEKGLGHIRNADASVIKGVVQELKGVAVQADWTFGGDKEKQSAARKFVLEQMTHQDGEVRRAALEALVRVFGKDWVVVRSRADYKINPSVRSSLSEMAARDPDAGLREEAAKHLGYLESKAGRAVETILRERQSPEAK